MTFDTLGFRKSENISNFINRQENLDEVCDVVYETFAGVYIDFEIFQSANSSKVSPRV